ncbi:hypothetical protein IID19_05795, partial [Patescibacteria group bacterium]|nr:hypothetical protein [Patescibacteria group bacterium]
LQYLFSFIDSCGIMYRFDHLSILSEKFQTYADQLPEPKVNDSRTTNYREAIPVSTGEVLATGVGFDDNVFVDFGVYDLRQLNNAAQDPDWAYNDQSTFAPYGVCWFDLLSAADAATVRALPAGSSESGSQSDYCL